MPEFLSFFIVILAGLFFSGIFGRLHIPWVIALIAGGIIIGPFGLEILKPDSTLEFFGQIGLVFLMFMAGLETKLSSIGEVKKRVGIISILNGSIPFLAGYGIAIAFGYSNLTALTLGAIFVSSSVAVIVPALEARGLFGTAIGKSILGATVVQDVASLFILSAVLNKVQPVTALPLPLFYIMLIGVLVLFRWLMPRIRRLIEFVTKSGESHDLFEHELRLIIAILLGTVIFFEILGLHAIVAGFFAGLVIAETIKNDVIKEKIHALSYGIFIPIFFVIVGMNTNIGIFTEVSGAVTLTIAIVIGSLLSKFISGWISGNVCGFTTAESTLVGVATTPQLSTTLAAAFTGYSFGIIDEKLIAAMVVLSVVTTFFGSILIPIVAKQIGPRIQGPVKELEPST